VGSKNDGHQCILTRSMIDPKGVTRRIIRTAESDGDEGLGRPGARCRANNIFERYGGFATFSKVVSSLPERRHASLSDQSLAIAGLVEIPGLVEADWRGQFR
jgi:hypothetical protein